MRNDWYSIMRMLLFGIIYFLGMMSGYSLGSNGKSILFIFINLFIMLIVVSGFYVFEELIEILKEGRR